MGETLKAWERIKKGIDTDIWECGYWDDLDLIENVLKASEIIREKQVNVSALLELVDDLQLYNDYCDSVGGCKKLTQEEYDLVKGVLL